MTNDPQKFVVTDPRTFDGNAYEVGARGIAQLRALHRLVELSLGPAELMARNAYMERQMALGQEPDAAGWPDSPQGRIFTRLRRQTTDAIQALTSLERAVAFDPKHPPRA